MGAETDLAALAIQLETLRKELRRKATEIEQDQVIANVGAAEAAAKKGDGPSVLRHPKDAGTWALDVATKIGTTVAAKAIQSSLGL